MASIRENVSKSRSVTTFSVLYREGGRGTPQRSETFATRKQAERFRQLVALLGRTKALAEMNDAGDPGLTVDQLAAQFFAHKATDVTPRTLSDYRRDYANWISPVLGHRQAHSVDELDVQHLIDTMVRHASNPDPKSVRDRHMLISSMFKWGSARTRRLVDHNPCHETELPKVRKKPIKGMTIPEWHAFYATARAAAPEVADMALFLVATGWRWSEAAALTWAHVDDRGDVVVATIGQVVRRRPGEVGAIVADAKNETSLRATTITGTAASALRRRRVGQPLEGFVFTNPQGRRWHQSNFLARHWGPVSAVVFGEKRHTPHALRHTHALLLDRAGASLSQMSRRLGHSDIRTTVNTYGGLIGDVNTEVLDRLDALLVPEEQHDIVRGEVL